MSNDTFSAHLRLLAFDADDTLWDCQGHFDAVEHDYCRLLSAYGEAAAISESLFATETANMADLGYGSKAFTISLVENAIKVSRGQVTTTEIMRIIGLGKSLLRLPATPLPGVADTLRTLRARRRYRMVVFTKGDNLDQENKFRRSQLAPFFDDFIVVADKTPHEYARLCRQFGISIGSLCMVGNSYKSDIKPVLDLGGYAVHIPYHLTWQMEQTDEPGHPHLRRADRFAQLTELL